MTHVSANATMFPHVTTLTSMTPLHASVSASPISVPVGNTLIWKSVLAAAMIISRAQTTSSLTLHPVIANARQYSSVEKERYSTTIHANVNAKIHQRASILSSSIHIRVNACAIRVITIAQELTISIEMSASASARNIFVKSVKITTCMTLTDANVSARESALLHTY